MSAPGGLSSSSSPSQSLPPLSQSSSALPLGSMRRVPSAGSFVLDSSKPKLRRALSHSGAMEEPKPPANLHTKFNFAQFEAGLSPSSSPVVGQPPGMGAIPPPLGASAIGAVAGQQQQLTVEEKLKELDMTRATKVPASEVYGFVAYLASFVAFGIFLAWAYLPEQTLQQLGFTFYPDKYWAVALPVYGLSLLFFVFVFFIGINLLSTPALDSIYTVTDEHAHVIEDLGSQIPKNEHKISEIMDIPVSVVNKCLYRNLDDEIVKMGKKRTWVV